MNLFEPESNQLEIVFSSLANGRVGITPSVGQSVAEAASVCLDDQGHSSPTNMTISGKYDISAMVDWIPPTEQAKRCWNDDQYTTEQGAYCVAFLLVEQCGLVVVERAKKKTGFDYWLGRKDEHKESLLLQKKSRLEVSGIRKGDKTTLESRVKQKLNQTKVSDGLLPAIIVVVEFSRPIARMVERCKM